MNMLKALKNSFFELFQDTFKRSLFIVLLLIASVALHQAYQPKDVPKSDTATAIHFFFHPNCHHCKTQKEFNVKLKEQFPNIVIIEHNVLEPAENLYLRNYAQEHGISETHLGVPFTIVGERYFMGFDNEGVTAKEVTEAVMNSVATKEVAAHSDVTTQKLQGGKTVKLPIIGDCNIENTSLLGLSVILGLVDGFNPCAMWVLVYLISIILGLNDKKKIWLLVGSFLFASGVLYFLFITAWLNVFLLVGYLRFVIILIGIFALWIGANDIRDFLIKKEIVCNVGDPTSKHKTIDRVNRLVTAPISLVTILGIVALAFVVNSIEFLCSSALPVIFTQTLTIHNLSIAAYYFYITVYVLFYMLDDIVIFSIAAFAATQAAGGAGYVRFSQLVGGIVLVGLGVLLLLGKV